ncbi:protein phosphatase 2C domain-containing protein [Jatrophihabitans sp.]|uniref:PP2C family protein-serine/threonine phosphatase n=1 Tax=Jatrophihabitans sp. TaxID=1932789 RepID=UPI0030C76FD9|nr:serine/threonine-protein phosphatase [Jatrophihabitans sp.]
MTLPAVTFGSATDVGCVRDHNEDALLAQAGVFIVADGMGGHAAGEVAAAIAVSVFARLAGRAEVQPDELLDCVADANAEVLRVSDEQPETAGMGTTVSGVVLTLIDGAPQWIVVNVGDSRTYLRTAEGLSRRTIDHSEVEELVLAGYLTPAEARVHPRRNVVTRSIGSDPAPLPDVWVLPASAGDQLLVCSDGLTNELDDGTIDQLLGSGGTPQEVAAVLVERARLAGGHDNITVIVVQL